jgi:hypothetical protein
MHSIKSRPRAASRRRPDAVIEPSGNASAAATESRSGVSGLISSRGGKRVRDLPIVRLPASSAPLAVLKKFD